MAPTPPKPLDELSLCAARLSRAAPGLWDQFVTAFATIADERVKACVNAQPTNVFEMQGRARQCSELTTLFYEAIPKANQAK